jgi:hypothetical protein
MLCPLSLNGKFSCLPLFVSGFTSGLVPTFPIFTTLKPDQALEFNKSAISLRCSAKGFNF